MTAQDPSESRSLNAAAHGAPSLLSVAPSSNCIFINQIEISSGLLTIFE